MTKKLCSLIVLMLLIAAAGTAMAIKAGDAVMFGMYPQSDENAAEPLEWRVLAVQGDKALIITDKIIDAMNYSAKTPCWWENSDLRAWMNGGFIQTAFTAEEQAALLETAVSDLNGSGQATTTMDRFFALSNDELRAYFASDSARMASPTAYARSKNVHYNWVSNSGWWWGRSQSDAYELLKRSFAHIETDGSVYIRGATASRLGKDNVGVRPAGWVSLSALTGGTAKDAESAESLQTGPSSVSTAASPIAFRGVSFGSTGDTFLTQMEKDGLTGSMKDTDPGSWEVYFKDGELVSETKLKNGGFLYTVSNIPDDFSVAGFKVSNLSATFLRAFDDENVYEEPEKATLMKASYSFQILDLDASYTVLRDKLTSLYGTGIEKNGTTHWTSTGGNYSESVIYTTWYGSDNTGVFLVAHKEVYDEGNRPKQQSLTLCYGSSDSIELIGALRSAMVREELEKSSDMNDVDGL